MEQAATALIFEDDLDPVPEAGPPPDDLYERARLLRRR
jgi:hypothetical protein